MSIYQCTCCRFNIYICIYCIYMENGTHRKRQLSFFCCKCKAETENFHFYYKKENGKQKFVFLGRQTINGSQHLQFQQTCLPLPDR